MSTIAVIASEAKQSMAAIAARSDCFVASLHRSETDEWSSTHVSGMTNGEEENDKSRRARQACHRPMPVRQGRLRDRRAGALGLARSFGRRAAARMARPMRPMSEAGASVFGSPRARPAITRYEDKATKTVRSFCSHCGTPLALRTPALAAHGQHPARAVFGPHRAAAALSHRDRGIAGMGLHRRAAGAAEGFSRRGLAALEKEEARRARGDVLNWSSGAMSSLGRAGQP